MKAIAAITALTAVVAMATPDLGKATKARSDYVTRGLLCIHTHEGAWNSNTGNGYYGGMQMDQGFMHTYGSEFMRKWGTADAWPAWVQLLVSRRAYYGYGRYGPRGFGPWPNSRRLCGV